MNRLLMLSERDWVAPLLVCAAAMALMTIARPSFFSPFNLQILLLAVSINAMIAFSQMIIIAIGQMNLAVGALGGFSAVIFAGMMEVWGLPVPLAVILAVAVAVVGGALNGLIIAKTRISAFVVTLATLFIFRGLNLAITRAQPFYGVPEPVKQFGNTTFWAFLPWLLIPAVAVAVSLWYLLTRMRLGRAILAFGGNPKAAELCGISATAVTVWVHAISAAIAALAGLMLVCRLQIGQPTIGDDWLILSFAAPVIGGAALTGGQVDVIATVLGVIIVAIITQALVLFDIDPFLVQVVLGFLILSAVGLKRLKDLSGHAGQVRHA